MQNQKNHEEQVKDLHKLVESIKFGMLVTVEKDGSLRSRPMACQKLEKDGSVWFFTYGTGGKCAEIAHDKHVNISFSEPKDQKYVSLSGRAELSHDKDKMTELWNPIYKAWFPQGLETPDIALLRIVCDKAEYWDSPSNTIVRLVGFAKAVLTGRAADNVGTHEKVNTCPLVGESTTVDT